MVFRHAHSKGTWIDLEQPSVDEIQLIVQEFSIGERIESELLAPTPCPLIASERDIAFIVLHFPTHSNGSEVNHTQELDFIIGPKFIITIRYEVIAPLHEVQKLLEAEEMLSERTSFSPDILLEILFAHLYASTRNYVQFLSEHLTHVEKRMFEGQEHSTIRSISNISREFLHLEASLAGQEEPLTRFLTLLSERDFYGPSFSERMNRILAERLQVTHFVKTHRSVVSELRETNLALIETTQNGIMRTLTVVNVIFLPLGLIAWIFTMRTNGMPFVDSPNAFYIIVSIMAIVVFTLIALFIKKRWIF